MRDPMCNLLTLMLMHRFSKVFDHLVFFLHQSEFFVERHILIRTIEDDLVATIPHCLVNQRLDNRQAQTLSPSIRTYNDVLDVSHLAALVNEFVLHQQRPSG